MPCSETKVLTELREQAPAQIEALRAEQHNAEAEAQEAERRAAELRARADGITISTRWLDGQLPRGDGKAARPILPWSIAAAGQPAPRALARSTNSGGIRSTLACPLAERSFEDQGEDPRADLDHERRTRPAEARRELRGSGRTAAASCGRLALDGARTGRHRRQRPAAGGDRDAARCAVVVAPAAVTGWDHWRPEHPRMPSGHVEPMTAGDQAQVLLGAGWRLTSTGWVPPDDEERRPEDRDHVRHAKGAERPVDRRR